MTTETFRFPRWEFLVYLRTRILTFRKGLCSPRLINSLTKNIFLDAASINFMLELSVGLQKDGSLLFRIKPGTLASSRLETCSPTSAGVGGSACVYTCRPDGVRMLIETTCMRPASRLW